MHRLEDDTSPQNGSSTVTSGCYAGTIRKHAANRQKCLCWRYARGVRAFNMPGWDAVANALEKKK